MSIGENERLHCRFLCGKGLGRHTLKLIVVMLSSWTDQDASCWRPCSFRGCEGKKNNWAQTPHWLALVQTVRTIYFALTPTLGGFYGRAIRTSSLESSWQFLKTRAFEFSNKEPFSNSISALVCAVLERKEQGRLDCPVPQAVKQPSWEHYAPQSQQPITQSPFSK